MDWFLESRLNLNGIGKCAAFIGVSGNCAQTAGKPDVQVDFSFYQRFADGEKKYFNKTNPQELNVKTLPAEFDLTRGHQLLSSLSVPLATFPPGDYRLEIKVTDKPSGKSLTNNVDFSVSAS